MLEASDRCGVCGQEFSFHLPRCGVCGKMVCASCAVRLGGSVFCGKVCSQIFFYGGGEEGEEKDAEESED